MRLGSAFREPPAPEADCRCERAWAPSPHLLLARSRETLKEVCEGLRRV